jgi:hypothetical protein
MILVNLRGGLGNQLFQLGAALRLSRGSISNICLNTEHLGDRSFEISKWIESNKIPSTVPKANVSLFSNPSKVFLINDAPSGPFSDQHLLDSIIDTSSVDIVLDGYFQSGLNLLSLRNHVFSSSCSESVSSFTGITSDRKKTCSIHYRSGDYFRIDVQKEIGLINLAYLDRAISNLYDKYETINIYSEPNDLLQSYAEKNGLSLQLGLPAENVFQELVTSETLVICNSSFALAAAFLSKSLQMLVRPARWSRNYLNDSLTDHFTFCEVRKLSNSFYNPM